MKRLLLSFVFLWVFFPSAGTGQIIPPAARAPDVEVDPIRCWGRTSAGAVRLGEPFTLTMTCAVLQNDAVQVVPDESHLDSGVVEMTPFEVTGGAHPADLYRGSRRFFQYEYVLRVISPDVIGKDVRIPEMVIHYRINSTVAANTALQGRDHAYRLPAQSVRVLSLVPADAPDIRDTPLESFATAERLGFRANTLYILGITALILAALIALIGIVGFVVRKAEARPTGERGLAEAAVLGLAARELATVQRESGGQGWSADLVGRALAATRIAAAAAIGRPIGQQKGAANRPGEGQLMVPARRGQPSTILSGAATTEDLTRAVEKLPETANPDRRQLLENLQSALGTFTRVQYAREPALDSSALNEALTRSVDSARRLRSQRTWTKTYFRNWMPRAEVQEA